MRWQVGSALHYGDFRLDPENLPLWTDWAAFPNGRDAIHPDFSADAWLNTPSQQYVRFDWSKQTLWQTPGNDGDAFVQRSRGMMLPFGVVLGILIALVVGIGRAGRGSLRVHHVRHGSEFPGAYAACKKCGRSPAPHSRWRLRSGNWDSELLLGGPSPFFSSRRRPWASSSPRRCSSSSRPRCWWHVRCSRKRGQWQRQMLAIRRSRFFAAMGVNVLLIFVAFTSIWAMYGFRFSPTPDPNVLLDMQPLVERRAANSLLRVDPHHMPTTQEVQSVSPDALVRTVLFCQNHELLPQAWLWGLLVQYAANIYRATFLMGVNSEFGPWYYFPMAMLFKTPVATLVAMVATAIVLFMKRRKFSAELAWPTLCLATPAIIYFASSMASGVAAGIRHILPIYPAIYVAIGIAASLAWRARPALGRATIVLLAVLLCVETFAAFPDYIAFFNFACGGTPQWNSSAGGFKSGLGAGSEIAFALAG